MLPACCQPSGQPSGLGPDGTGPRTHAALPASQREPRGKVHEAQSCRPAWAWVLDLRAERAVQDVSVRVHVCVLWACSPVREYVCGEAVSGHVCAGRACLVSECVCGSRVCAQSKMFTHIV